MSPLGDEHDERILKRLEQTIYSVVAGSLIVGLIQGILTGIGFAIFGVPSPAIWGSIAAVAALIPGFGTSLVIVPGILYLFLTGSTAYAIGLLIWGMLAVDKSVRRSPRLIGSDGIHGRALVGLV